jgi:hypothetical protein
MHIVIQDADLSTNVTISLNTLPDGRSYIRFGQSFSLCVDAEDLERFGSFITAGVKPEPMDPKVLVEFGCQWRDLGQAIGEQVEQLLCGDDTDLNPAAIREAKRMLAGYHPRVDEVMDEYLTDR